MPTPEEPYVVVLSLGGTVGMTTSDASGAKPTVGAAELVATVPDLRQYGRVLSHSLSSVPSASLRLSDLVKHVLRMEALCYDGARGLIVTTGTDTLDEVAFLFDLWWSRDEPLVVTGAMRTADATGSDGPANLLAATAVAASPAARGRGCIAVLNDDVHSGRRVRKAHTTRLDAFTSGATGPLGRVHEGQVQLRPAEPRRMTLPLRREVTDMPRVALLRLTIDQDVELLDYAAAEYDGVVVEAFGAGHVPEWWMDALERATQQVPVAVTSRTGAGALLRSTYGFRGSERDLVNLNIHLLDDLEGVKARLLLVSALLSSRNRETVDEIMSSYARSMP